MLEVNKDFEALKKNIGRYYQKHLIDRSLKKAIWGLIVVFSFSLSIIIAEYFLYLNSGIKTAILYLSLISIILFSVFWVFIPLLKILSIIKSPHLTKISEIIRREVPSISDEIINAIQLNNNRESLYSKELVNASVSQKSIKLNATGFESSIKLQKNKKTLKWAAIPLAIFLIIGLVYPSVIKSSTERLVGYDTNYSPPAPFNFIYKNQKKEILEFEDFNFVLQINGKEIPQKAEIVINGLKYPLRSSSIGSFSFLKKNIAEDLAFYFQSQGFKSKRYYLKLVPKARIENINIECIYPDYLQMPRSSMKNLQNLNLPEGTIVKWFFNSKNTEAMEFVLKDSIISLNSEGGKFNAKYQVFNNIKYGIVCHNESNHIQEDTMFFNIKVVPDIHPKISVKTFVDSLNSSMAYFNGSIEDDQGFSSLYFLFSKNKTGPFKRKKIDISYEALSQEFYYYINIDSFDTESLYYYFMVADNDAINGFKKTKTITKTIKALNNLEKQALIKSISDSNKKAMEKLKEKSKQKLNEVIKIQEKLMQKERLDWLDKQLIKDLIKEQSSFLNKLETFSKKEQQRLKSPLMTEKLKDEFAEKQKQLQEMFNKLIPEELKELMNELQKMEEDLNKEESMDMLEKLEISNEEISDELDRMAELLKQFEFDKSLQDIIDNLSELEKKQKKESEETLNNDKSKEEQVSDQEEIKGDFDQIKKQLDDLDKINNDLERSHKLKDHDDMENSIENKMEEAINDLKSGKNKKGGKKQKETSEQIQNMKESMIAMQEDIASQTSSVDMALLEKLLDNLVQISFNQESLIERAKNINPKGHKYKQYIQEQYNINEDLIVIEDSLKALSKRVAQLESFIMKELKKSKKNLNKSINELTKRKTSSAKISQQRTMTSFNNLALMLSESLQQMQNQAASNMKGCQNCQKKDGNKPGSMPSLSKLQKQLEQQLKEMKEGKGKKGKRDWNKGLAKSAIKQAKIRALLEELSNNGQNGKKGDGEDLKKIMEEMEQNEKDIVNNRIDENLFKRIQDINTRLLKAEKAMKERELSKEREAVKPSHYSPKIPEGLKKFIKEKDSNKDAYKSIPPELYPFYKDLVNKYFKTMK